MKLFWEKLICDRERSKLIPIYKKEQAKKQSLDVFLQKYAPPKEVVDYLSTQTKAFFKECVTQKLPKQIKIENTFYWIKGRKSIERIFNAIRVKECIVQNNLTRLDVAKKYIYCHDNTYLIIAEHVEKDYTYYEQVNEAYVPQKAFFDEEVITQLYTLITKTGFIDWALYHNVAIDQNKKIIFIDTEDRSFFDYKAVSKNGIYAHVCHAQVIKRILDFVLSNNQTDFAMWIKKHIKNEIDRCKNDYIYCKQNKIILLPCNSNLDPVDFDLTIIRKKLALLKNRKVAS